MISPTQSVIEIYTAILNQTGTDNPVVTVLHDTLKDTISWVRTSTGLYTATLTEGIPVGKGVIMITTGFDDRLLWAQQTTVTTIAVVQKNTSFVTIDGLINVTIEIRKYELN